MTSRRKGVANVDLWTQVHLPARCQVLHVPAQDVIPGYYLLSREIYYAMLFVQPSPRPRIQLSPLRSLFL